MHKEEDKYSRQFSHVIGETNLLRRTDDQYLTLLGLIADRTSSEVSKRDAQSKKRLRDALQWLVVNNRFYKLMHANIETLYAYFGNANPLNINPIDVVTVKDSALLDELGEERIGYFLPAQDPSQTRVNCDCFRQRPCT
uniref:Uncharacterized protein n=2 Tax=Photinus pyralis TaxID=7054 RepID=A0A1Y1K5N4_PHOPY